MNKLSLEALKMRAEAVTTEELMANIGGGTENSCHNAQSTPKKEEKSTAEEMLGWFLIIANFPR